MSPVRCAGMLSQDLWRWGAFAARQRGSSLIVLLLCGHCLLTSKLALAHSGHELPEKCDSPKVLCWSTKLRNSLAPGALSLLQTLPHTHDLRCEDKATPKFRGELSALFADVPTLTVDAVRSYVVANLEEIESLSVTYDETMGMLNPRMMGGSRFISMDRTDCHLVYLVGKLLYPFGQQDVTIVEIVKYLHTQGVLDLFWNLILHWIDVARTQFPIISVLEFLALGLRREQVGSTVDGRAGFGLDFDRDTDVATEDLYEVAYSGSASAWAVLGSRLLLASKLGTAELSGSTPLLVQGAGPSRRPGTGPDSRVNGHRPLAAAAAYLALALALLDRAVADGGSSGSWEVQSLITSSLSWLKAIPNVPATAGMQLLHSAWPVLPLWGRLWRHPNAAALLAQPSLECPAFPQPVWELRRLHTHMLQRSLPGGRWPLLPPSPGLRSPSSRPEIRARSGEDMSNKVRRGARGTTGSHSGREAWATAVAIAAKGPRPAETIAWVDAVRVLHASIRRHEDSLHRRPFVVVVEDGMDKLYTDALRSDGMILVAAEPVIVPEHLAACGNVQRRAEGLRFRLFALTSYDRIVYLDADAIVVSPLDYLFNTPRGVFLSATVNGTRWVWKKKPAEDGQDGFKRAKDEQASGPPMLNTGLMVITPDDKFLPALAEVIDTPTWKEDGGWAGCMDEEGDGKLDGLRPGDSMSRRVCEAYGVFAAFCTQGIIDAVIMATTRRLGHAVFGDSRQGTPGQFLGCRAKSNPSQKFHDDDASLVMPKPWEEHCTLDEGHNLQVTRPHLQWHMPFLRHLQSEGGVVSMVHWPGRPKPWTLAPGQRSDWELRWWDLHEDVCQGLLLQEDRPLKQARREGERHCFLRCG
eukprot:TRINITY_DN63655_c0_g1_i1.p1 TRINITY_DN63655_c0_g1~~TRINITY_DN63655_c0_g1_i1.p1  ORF type:complete len:865 (-),score=145.01 TRINITY_DN63655_c0_g1_i1:33-2627(-)